MALFSPLSTAANHGHSEIVVPLYVFTELPSPMMVAALPQERIGPFSPLSIVADHGHNGVAVKNAFTELPLLKMVVAASLWDEMALSL